MSSRGFLNFVGVALFTLLVLGLVDHAFGWPADLGCIVGVCLSWVADIASRLQEEAEPEPTETEALAEALEARAGLQVTLRYEAGDYYLSAAGTQVWSNCLEDAMYTMASALNNVPQQ